MIHHAADNPRAIEGAAPASHAAVASHRATPAVQAAAWSLVALAAGAVCLFYTTNDGRERALWSVFGHLAGLRIVWGGADAHLGGVAAAWLFLLGTGWVVLRAFRPFLPPLHRVETLAISTILGMGAIGLCGEFLALAGRLRHTPMSLAWLAVVGGFGFAGRRLRQAASAFTTTDVPNECPWPADRASPWQRSVALVFLGLAGLIFFFIAWHALLYPVTYWDAMILYVGYARMIHALGGVPEFVVGQVGIGLGANYPHLFAFLHVGLCRLFTGEFTSAYAQSISPLCGVCIAGLLYATVRRLSGGRWAASATVLLSVSFHYISAYYQYASNYPLAMALTAVYLWAALVHLQTRSWGALALAVAAAALAVHVNYLMWGLWIGGLLLAALAPWRRELYGGGRFWAIAAAGLVLALPWYVRNVIVTGNPVYAFYANVFPSKNVNPEVMESAAHEWVRNGDGIGRHALDAARMKLAVEQLRAEGTEVTQEAFDAQLGALESADVPYSLGDKLRMTVPFFATGSQAYKLSPVFLGWMVPGLMLALALGLSRIGGRIAGSRRSTTTMDAANDTPPQRWSDLADGPALRFLALTAFLFFFFLFYHYAVADFYLYQILPFLVAGAIFAGLGLAAVERARPAAAVASALLLATGLVPGLVFALMGLKVFPDMRTPLRALSLPLVDPEEFYRLRYGGDVDMWRYVNEHLKGERLLTHENRLLAIDPSIRIVQLDDWEMQQAYDLPTPEAKLRLVIGEGIRYYLRVPNEEKHPVNLRLGIGEFIGTPVLREVFRASGVDGDNVLYEIVPEALGETVEK